MPKIEFRVDDNLAAAFAAAYPGRGDRSAILRRAVHSLIERKEGSEQPAPVKQPTPELLQKSPKGRARQLHPGRTVPVSVRLTPEQYIGIEDQALRIGMETSAYIRALVDSHLGRDPDWPKEARGELTFAATQLRKAGVNLNQLTFLCRTAVKENRPFPIAKNELEEVFDAVNVLKDAFLGVLANRDSYWRMKGDRDV